MHTGNVFCIRKPVQFFNQFIGQHKNIAYTNIILFLKKPSEPNNDQLTQDTKIFFDRHFMKFDHKASILSVKKSDKG